MFFRLFPQLNETGLFELLNKESIILLGSILRWVCSESKPDYFIENKKMFFYFSKVYFSNSPFFSKPTLLKSFKNLIDKHFILDFRIKTGKKYFYAFDWVLISSFIENECWLNYIKKIQQEEKMNCLFEFSENKYPEQAIKIVEKIISSTSIFKTKNNHSSKTFQASAKFIADLHAGLVTNPRIYPIKDERKEFSIDGWKEKLESVKLNWASVEKLVIASIKNYKLMFEMDYVPYNKSYLPNSLDKYFYNPFSKESFFIRSLNEPMKSNKFLSEKKADNIFESLPASVQQAGEELLDLNPSLSSGIYWEKIKEIYEWSLALKECENSSGYWFGEPSDLIYKYCDFLKSNKINLAINTIDISKIDSGFTPWKRFLEMGIKKHELNPELISCANAEDIYELYHDSEIPVF